MNATHTPGPWVVTPLGEFGNITVSGRNGEPVAMCGTEAIEGGGNGREVDETNASLIAAAPELLEALRAFIDNDGPDPEECERMARAAIAKAERTATRA